jgi:hypothetical protein
MTRKGEALNFFKENVHAESAACVEWPYRCNANGYGTIMIRKRSWLVHRYAWTCIHGPIPGRLLVCHRCDNRRCFNPEHLFLGTDRDNCLDMIRKGRQADLSEFKHPRASLTVEIIEDILRLHCGSPKAVSLVTGVPVAIVKNILYGKSWVGVTKSVYSRGLLVPHPAWIKKHGNGIT